MNRDQVALDVEIRHERRTEAVRRTVTDAPDVLSAREALRRGLSALPGVSDDPRTMTDIMLFVDTYMIRIGQEDGQL